MRTWDALRARRNVHGARHIAGAAAAIAWVLPQPPDDRTRLVDRYESAETATNMVWRTAFLKDTPSSEAHPSNFVAVSAAERARRYTPVT
jgi:hypothetical protein